MRKIQDLMREDTQPSSPKLETLTMSPSKDLSFCMTTQSWTNSAVEQLFNRSIKTQLIPLNSDTTKNFRAFWPNTQTLSTARSSPKAENPSCITPVSITLPDLPLWSLISFLARMRKCSSILMFTGRAWPTLSRFLQKRISRIYRVLRGWQLCIMRRLEGIMSW